MIVTIEEAKTKWCPMVRYLHTEREWIRANRPGGVDQNSFCIGDQCMMWVYSHTYATKEEPRTGIGYCGLAPP